jgi:hypothetical protein
MQDAQDDIGRSEYPTSAGLSFDHSFAHSPRLFCLKEPPLTSPSDKAPIFLPYLCYLRAFGRSSPPAITQPNFSSVLSSADSLHQLRSLLHRGNPSSRHFIRRACWAGLPPFSLCQDISRETRPLPIFRPSFHFRQLCFTSKLALLRANRQTV